MTYRYLRIVVNTRCPMHCAFCHMEGDPATGGQLPLPVLNALVEGVMMLGVHKVKWLGGEPLVRADLPQHVGFIRARFPDADLSVITSGTGPLATLEATFEAGLSRANLSIHGWGEAAFSERGPVKLYARRNACLDWLLNRGRQLKLNYVYCGQQDDADLAGLLAAAAALPVVVNTLDDLTNPMAGHQQVLDVVRRLRGREAEVVLDKDPASLDTLHLVWSDGLRVEVKHLSLGVRAPFLACGPCPKRSVCREGILALRLTHDGTLLACMDRPDLGLNLLPVLERGGPIAVAEAVADWEANLAGRVAA